MKKIKLTDKVKDIIVRRFLNLEKQTKIAKDYKVTKQAIFWVIKLRLKPKEIAEVKLKKRLLTAKNNFNI